MNNLVVYHMVEKLKDKYIKLWWYTDKCFPSFNKEIGFKEKMLREKHMNKFLNDLFCLLKKCPKNEDEQKAWKNTLWAMIKNFGHTCGFTEFESIHGYSIDDVILIATDVD